MMPNNSAAQSKSHSLVGLLTNVNVLSSQILSNPKILTGENLVKLSVSSTPIFTNLGAVELLSTDQDATNIDVSSRLMPFNIPQLQGCTPCRQYPKHFGDSHSAKESAQCGGSEHRSKVRPMFEFYIAGIPASKQYQNRDLYVGAGGDVLKSQDIKKRSTYSCIGQKADAPEGQHCDDNNADAKIITAAYCQQSKPCYISIAAAKSADGRRNPNYCMATPGAFSVFFCVDATAHPFFTDKIRSESMVALVGRRSRLPESIQSGIPTPANVTTNQSVGTPVVIKNHCMEAAKWLLPSPQNRHLSGLSPLFAVIVRLSKQLFTISPHLLSAKPVYRLSKTTFASLRAALIRGWLMSKVYQSPYDLAEKADTILEVLNVIDGVIAQDCPNQKRTLTALNDLMRLAVTDLYHLLDGCELEGGNHA
ncbi:Ash protein family protein [Rosenbergiella nectarea]|uniref:Ash protein family protein n=1 Tax=Rosenbergiella nectarea TaxID=988801 RepID=A0A1H9M4V4_9GAMM|nr:Ash protein family protein [Rosenbergiella nectarea]